ncbi:MAG: Smr/MutS family protein [Moraxellaceae bacterium]|nr:Smr/MutS family protein [Moraxellaceae bacterium]MDP1775658.1 Smr/MutS family protein [Moraxellaceae bacterium]
MKDPALNALKRQLKAQASQPPKPANVVAVKHAEEELSDEQLLAKALKGVKPSQAPPPPPRPNKPRKVDALTALRRANAEGGIEREQIAISDTVALMQPVDAEATLAFQRSGVQLRQFEKLRTGALPWRGAVDLHGCTIEQAREAVLQLIDEAKREGLQVIKIVHGKGHINGQALLKTSVNGWLKQLPDVIAFSSAPPRDGGTGAVLVLLKRHRQETTR